MKDAQYFPHDYNASEDPKIVRMIREEGAEAYGIYWLILEKLYNANGQLEADYESIAYILHSDPKKVMQVTEKWGLFYIRSKKIRSYSVDRRLKEREEKRQEKIEAGRRGGLRSGQARSKHTLSKPSAPLKQNSSKTKQNEPNEMKGKEIKEKTTNVGGLPAPVAGAQPASEYKADTPIQKIVVAYKIAKGLDWRDRDWDSANYARAAHSAKSLLKAFKNDVRPAADWLVTFGDRMKKADRTWTLETAAKHAWDDGRTENGQ